MNHEKKRLGSYQNFPDYGRALPTRLARAGLYYTRNGDEVQCFSCGVRIDNWGQRGEPQQEHRTNSPRCPFVTGVDTTNVPFRATEEDKKAHAELTRTGRIPANIVTTTTTNTTTTTTTTTTTNTSSSNTSSSSSSSRPRTPPRSDRRIPSGLLGGSPPLISPNSPPSLAPSRTSHQGTSGTSPQSIGDLYLIGDISEDRPTSQHFQGLPRSDDTIDTNTNPNVSSTRTGQQGVPQASSHTPVSSTNVPPPADSIPAQTAVVTTTTHRPPESSNPAVQQPISATEPRHPHYSTDADRLETYTGWPTDREQRPLSLARAGFFFEGSGDTTRCWWCHGGLQNWLPGDVPWVEHARWFPGCSFVARIQGSDFVTKIAQGEHVVPRISASENQPSARTTITTTSTTTSTKSTRPAQSSSQLGTGSGSSSIKSVTAPTTATAVTSTATAVTSLATAVTSSATAVTSTATSAVSTAVPGVTGEASGQQKPSKKKKTKKKAAPAPADDGGDGEELDEQLATLIAQKQELEDRNRELKEQEKCKVCMDEEISIVFLPCGHRVTCASCAANLRDCPMCRVLIRGTVKSFLV